VGQVLPPAQIALTGNVFVIEEDGTWVGGVTYWLRDLIICLRPVLATLLGYAYTVLERQRGGVFSPFSERFGGRAPRSMSSQRLLSP